MPQIKWSSYHDAYGTAKDIPKVLEALKADDSTVREKALDHLFFSIYHQGDIYTATAPAVEALIQLVANKQTPDRAKILGLVEAITESAAHVPRQFVLRKESHNPFTDTVNYSLQAKAHVEKGFQEVFLPVQRALVSHRATLENLPGNEDGTIVELAEVILDLAKYFPYSGICDPVYHCLAETEFDAATAFASANPAMTFSQLASALGKRVSALQVWWALFDEARTDGNIKDLARGTLVREIREHTRERGWGVPLHFARMYERLEASWFSRFSDYHESCTAVWVRLGQKAEKGWLPQTPDDPIIRACCEDDWRESVKTNLATNISPPNSRIRKFIERMMTK